MDAFANSWIDCMKLVIYSTVPDILPFFKAESGNTGFKLGCRTIGMGSDAPGAMP